MLAQSKELQREVYVDFIDGRSDLEYLSKRGSPTEDMIVVRKRPGLFLTMGIKPRPPSMTGRWAILEARSSRWVE
jgi:hypothetical protein